MYAWIVRDRLTSKRSSSIANAINTIENDGNQQISMAEQKVRHRFPSTILFDERLNAEPHFNSIELTPFWMCEK